MPEEMYLYFAHPIETYAMPETQEILREIKRQYSGYKIIDPEDIELTWDGEFSSCRDCMERRKVELFPLIEKCNLFAIWAPVNSCEIKCELYKAWELGKPAVHISYLFGEVDFEDITLKEYHLAESVQETV